MARKALIKLTTDSFIIPVKTKSSSSTTTAAETSPPESTDSKQLPSEPAGLPTPPYEKPQDTNALASNLGKRKAADLTPPPSAPAKAVGAGHMAEPPAKRSRPDTNDRGNKVDAKEVRDGDRRDDRGGRDNKRRERSRSPVRGGRRGARRGRSRTPPGRDTKNGARNRSPPRGPRGRASSPPRKPSGKAAAALQSQVPIKVEKMDIDSPGADDVEAQAEYMKKVMGFAGFKTTKNSKVPGNDKLYGVRRETVIKARQYMNRTGGFNRPLSPGRS